MFRYFARLHEKHALPVYPVAVFSHEGARPEPTEYRVEFPDLEVLHFKFRSIQLQRLSWREYLRRPNPVAAALMARMQMASEERPRVKLECLRLLTTLRLDPARMKLIGGFIDTYLRLNPDEALRFQREADTVLSTNERSRMLEITTSWEEKGREEGWRKGRQEGREEGIKEGRRGECLRLVVRQLQRRIGFVDPATQTEINGLSTENLEALAEALLDFTSSADLQTWLSETRTN